MIIVDTSALLAAADQSDPRHADVALVLTTPTPGYLVSPFCVAEADYLALTRWGVDRELLLLDWIERSFEIAPFDSGDLALARKVIAKYADQEIGLADASIVVLAHRHRTRRVITLDQRHFTVMRGPGGRPFDVLPKPVG